MCGGGWWEDGEETADDALARRLVDADVDERVARNVQRALEELK